MLSQQPHPASGLRQHRRQHSTPTAHQAPLAALSPSSPRKVGISHRRGMSLIQPSSLDDRQVSITNPQHIFLQETQPHHQPPPGQSPTSATPLLQQFNLSEEEFRTLQHRQLDAQLDYLMKANSALYDNQHYVKIERSRSNPEHQKDVASPTAQPPPPGSGATLTSSAAKIRPTSSEGLSHRAKQLALHPNSQHLSQRPLTPPNQSNFDYNPLTPATTPFTVPRGQFVRQHGVGVVTSTIQSDLAAASMLFGDNLALIGLDPDATVKPGAGHISPSTHAANIFASPVLGTIPDGLPSPPSTVQVKSRKFDVATMPSQSELEDLPMINLVSQSRHQTPGRSPALSTMPSSPEFGSVKTPGGSYTNMDMTDEMDFDLYGSPDQSPQMSIADLSLDGTVEDTGISPEEVQAYISEQDPHDQKWTCMFPECGKKFGRRENIRSHIQTHLGDRQFKCAHCSKRFVRQHDLKRHSKIHSGVKPYPCRCGQSFARHDALTRHRQRNMCIGAFEGIVKKTAKRGRPRKHRTEDEGRLDKSNETRKRANALAKYASSVSCTSESSRGDSPIELMSDSPFGQMTSQSHTEFGQPLSTTGLNYFPPEFFTCTPPHTPYSTGNVDSPTKSPSQYNLELTHTPPGSVKGSIENDTAISKEAEVKVPRATRSQSQSSSQAGSPPELSHSSPPSSTRLTNMDFGPMLQEPGRRDFDIHNDFDMFAIHSQQQGDLFDATWDDNPLLALDKETGGFRMDAFTSRFDDEVLFSDNIGADNDFV